MIDALPSPEPVLERNCETRTAPGFLHDIQEQILHREVVMHRGKALVASGTSGRRLAFLTPGESASLPADALTVYLGEVLPGSHPELPAGTQVLLKVMADDADPSPLVPEGLVFQGYRDAAASLSVADAAIYIQAQAVANWHLSHPRCPRCGAETTSEQAGWMRRCTVDGSEHFPRTDPAVIVAVVGKDDRILLASNFAWPANRYSTVAGFVEAGESLEQAAVREIHEEVGVHLHATHYLGSQPWPFPRSLMLGYVAYTNDTEATPDDQEVREARWFGRQELQELVLRGEVVISQRLSIARALIEHWYGGIIVEPNDSELGNA